MVAFIISVLWNIGLMLWIGYSWYENGKMQIIHKMRALVSAMHSDWEADLVKAEAEEKTDIDKEIGIKIRMAKLAYISVITRVLNAELDKFSYAKVGRAVGKSKFLVKCGKNIKASFQKMTFKKRQKPQKNSK